MSLLSLWASWSSRLGRKFLSGSGKYLALKSQFIYRSKNVEAGTGVLVSLLTQGHPMSLGSLSEDSNVLAACSGFFMAVA